MSKAKMRTAREFIREKRYSEARAILKTVDHPTARQWLKKLDQLAPEEKKQRSSTSSTSTSSNRIRNLILPRRGRSRVYWFFFAVFVCIGCYALSLFGQFIGVIPTSAELNATRTIEASTLVAQVATDDAIIASTTTAQALTQTADELAQQMTADAQATNFALTPPTETPTIDLTGTQNAILLITVQGGQTLVASTLTQAVITPSATVTPIVEPTAIQPTLAPAEFWYTTAGVNARSCPNTECDVVTVLLIGTRVEVVGLEQGEAVNNNTVWRMVIAGGQTTYVHSSFLTLTAPPPTVAPVQQQFIPPTQNQSQAPSYTCTGDIFNCSDFNSCGDARDYFNACPGDPSNLDDDDNGLPCESLCR